MGDLPPLGPGNTYSPPSVGVWGLPGQDRHSRSANRTPLQDDQSGTLTGEAHLWPHGLEIELHRFPFRLCRSFHAAQRLTRIPALATYISGPGAAADIELTLIKGVHGPLFLRVILVRDSDRRSARSVVVKRQDDPSGKSATPYRLDPGPKFVL